MNVEELSSRFSKSRTDQQKAIFSTLFIAGNRLQTLFDQRIPDLTLKQFMVLSILRQSEEPMSLTQMGMLLGCSRQNIKKLAVSLEKKGYVRMEESPKSRRALCLAPTKKADAYFENEFRPYQKELEILFEVYSPEEIETLFVLMTKLYAGIDHLQVKTESTSPQNVGTQIENGNSESEKPELPESKEE